LQVVPVVPQRRAPAARAAQRFEDMPEVLPRVVPRRPVAPVLGDDPIQAALRPWQLVVDEVPAHPGLARGDAERAEGGPWLQQRRRGGQRQRGVAGEAVRRGVGGPPGRQRAPVVADQHGTRVAAELGMQREDIAYLVGDQVAVVRGELGRCVAPGERRDGPPAPLGKEGPEMAPGPRGVRVPADHQRQRSASVAPGKGTEAHTGGVEDKLFGRVHTGTLLRRDRDAGVALRIPTGGHRSRPVKLCSIGSWPGAPGGTQRGGG
jgi:hypothetical protein